MISDGAKTEPAFCERILILEVEDKLSFTKILDLIAIGYDLNLYSLVWRVHELCVA